MDFEIVPVGGGGGGGRGEEERKNKKKKVLYRNPRFHLSTVLFKPMGKY